MGDRCAMFAEQNRLEIDYSATFRSPSTDVRPGQVGRSATPSLRCSHCDAGAPSRSTLSSTTCGAPTCPLRPETLFIITSHACARRSARTPSSGRPTAMPSQGRAPTRSSSRTCSARRARRCATAMRVRRPTSRPARSRSGADRLWKVWLTTDSVRAEADRLEELRIDALEERFEAALELGEHREIVSELQQAVHEHPFRERLWRQLMLALYRSGRAADALEAYQSARRVHVEQLGLEPGPELRRTQEAILAHDPSIAGVSATGGRGALAAAREPPRRARTRAGPAAREPPSRGGALRAGMRRRRGDREARPAGSRVREPCRLNASPATRRYSC